MIEFVEPFATASPPCVGGRYFLDLCDKAGLRRTTPVVPLHAYRWAEDVPAAVFTTTVTRHPLTWLAAYYFEIQGQPRNIPSVDVFSECYRGARSFDGFVVSYLSRGVPLVGQLFDEYPAVNAIRSEDFPWAAVEYLQTITGQRLPGLVDVPFIRRDWGVMTNRELRRRVCRLEEEFCDRMEYY